MSEFQPFFKNGQTFLLSKKDNKNLLEKMSKVTDEENIIMQQNKNIVINDKWEIYQNECEKLRKKLNIQENVVIIFKCPQCKQNVNGKTMFHSCSLKCNFVHIGGLKCGGTRCKARTSHKGFVSNEILKSLPEHKQELVEKIDQIVTDSTATYNYIIRSDIDYKFFLANLMQIKFENKFLVFKKCECEKKKINFLLSVNQFQNDFSDSKSTLSSCGCSCIQLILRNIDNSQYNHDHNALIFIYIEKSNHEKNKGFKHLQNFRKNSLQNKKIFFIIDADSSLHYQRYLNSNSNTEVFPL